MNNTISAVKQEQEDHGKQQAIAQLASICEYVAALNCDYDRLEELREEYQTLKDNDEEARTYPDADDESKAEAASELQDWIMEYGPELAELETAAGDCEDQEQAQERLQEDPLSVEVRSDWHSPGDEESAKPSEFCILLCTGGPAVRIRGDLDEYGQPDRAYIQYQDWGTPWTDYVGHGHADELLTYCQQFYFGE